MVILLKRGARGLQPHRGRRALRHPRLPGARVAAAPHPAHHARPVPRHLRRRHHRRALPALRLAPAARVRRRLHADAGAAHLHLGGRPHRRRHLRAARPDHRRHRRPGRLGRPVQGLGVRRRGRPARLVVVGRGVRRQPRPARDDRDPEGEARVPVPAAHAHAGEERQGVALPADPPRRDHPRAHQPRRVPQVPAGAGERGAARPHGHHPGALHPVLQGRGAHLPQAHLLHPGVPRGAPRPARAARRRGVRGADAPRRRRRARGRRHKKVRLYAGEDVDGVSQSEVEKIRARNPDEGLAGRVAALRHQRAVQRHHPVEREEPDHHGRADRAQGRDRVRRAHRRQEEAQVGRLPGDACARTSTTAG